MIVAVNIDEATGRALSACIPNKFTPESMPRVSKEIADEMLEGKKIWKNGKVVDDPDYPARKKEQEEEEERRRHIEEIQQKVASLKAELASSDYKAIKYAEGWISEEEYAPIRTARQELRDKINALENELPAYPIEEEEPVQLVEDIEYDEDEEDDECSE